MDAHRRAGRPARRVILVAAALIAVVAAPAGGAPDDATQLPAIATITETTVDQFTAGAHSGTGVGEREAGGDSGHLRLLPLLNDVFQTPELGSVWDAARPSGFAPVITGGVLDVQERDDAVYDASAIESATTFTAGVVLEVRAAIHPGSAFVNVGFMDSTDGVSQWAYFGTRGSGDGPVPTLYTSVRGSDLSMVNLPTTITLGEWHVFKIVWTADTVEFHVDGVLVDTRTDVDISTPQRAAFYKSDASDSPLLVDWVRVTPHVVTGGHYQSVVFDAGLAAAPWTDITWDGDLPDGAAITFASRTGETLAPDGAWSPWSDAVGETLNSPPGRYAQYRVTLATADPAVSPVVDAVRISHSYPDATAPRVVATVPAADAVAVPVDAPLTVIFDEAIDPATVTAAITLDPGGPATVTYDPATFAATLTTDGPLANGVAYQARVAASVTDLDGNPLAADHVWTFTTAAPDVLPPAVAMAEPAAGAIDVVGTRPITVVFDEPLDAATVSTASVTVTGAGGAALPATVALDPTGRRVTLTPEDPLPRATAHEVRVTTAVADPLGNHLAADLAWTFTTSYLDGADLTATTDEDFAAATLAGAVVAEADTTSASGQVRLASRLDDRFDLPDLDQQWEITNPPGHVPVIAGGLLDVQAYVGGEFTRSAIQSVETWGPGVVLEARAMFVPGSGFIDVGFDANTLGNPQYAWFSTAGSGNQGDQARLTARVREYDHTTVAIDVPAEYNRWHVFKIVWTVGRVDFYLDGALVATHTDVLITQPLHAAFYKTNDSDTPFYIDWIRVTPYTGSTGTVESPVLDAGLAGARWRDLGWLGDTPPGTGIDWATRSGETGAPDAGWSPWASVVGGHVASPPGRYAQYRAVLTSADPLLSPVIDAVRVSHTTSTDLEAPTVTATEPEPGAAGVAPETLLRATFAEPLHPATVDAGSVFLTDPDGVPVPATVSYSEATRTVTLAPESELQGGATYTAHLATALADTAANRLGAAVAWTFTVLAAPGSEVPPPTVLYPNVPNPFNPITRVSFDLGQSGSVLLRVFTVDGRFVRTLIRADLEGGRRYWKTWDGRDEDGRILPAGTYLLRMETGADVQTSKMMLVR